MLRSCSKTTRHIIPLVRNASTAAASQPASKKGDIGDSFTSISGAEKLPLPSRFRQLKLDLLRGRENKLSDSWSRLLKQLAHENEIIASKKSGVIPEVQFSNLDGDLANMRGDIQKRGVVIVRGVIPKDEARAYKDEVEEYVRKNPHTIGFPQHDPQVFELYWSPPQVKARSHPSMMEVQQRLMTSLWTSSPDAQISLSNPLTYADRLRIRQPGDATFALGPHIDGGSVERWEKEGYGRGGVYDKILEGEWEKFDPFDAASRVDVVSNLYEGLGACSMLRLWQGWLSMSECDPEEGTLLVNPLIKLSTAYLLLRPFFRPIKSSQDPAFLDASNWEISTESNITSELHGASLDHRQELNDNLHPHLAIDQTMVHIPKMYPGDFVAWHCDSIHAVDRLHNGKTDSSVLYIPVCPVTEANAEYLVRQLDTFRRGTPAPDFPANEGEANHVGRSTPEMLYEWTGMTGREAMGLERLVPSEDALPGERAVLQKANRIIGFQPGSKGTTSK